ncbi:hypothetical protein [Intrasporangium flavum]|uniref:hypothetical protein n=1 Tax=Intrasporangium flavum TaxID=1428657 RepID=UPI00096CF136|nr:hypothetical protein [Intrasporangium flavum]
MSHAMALPTRVDDHASRVAEMSIRELIGALATTEERLRSVPNLVTFRGRLVANPERRLLLQQQRRVIGALRRRRAALRLPARRH